MATRRRRPHATTPTHEVVDFGPGPIDETQDYPYAGSEAECFAWLDAHQVTIDGRDRFAMQVIPDDDE
jgi:hypothetical protein